MVSLRKSRKLALLAASDAARTNRRSARLVELEERKRLEAEAARAAAAAAAAAGAQGVGAPAPTNGDQVTGRKRGRKRKHVDEVIVSSVYEPPFPPLPQIHGLKDMVQQGQSSQWQSGPSLTGNPSGYFTGAMPSKKTLESVLDVLQMMDSESMLAMPKSFELESTELENSLSRPQDFGTVRAKLHEGYYASFEHFESDIFCITARAKRSDPPESPVHKLASEIEQRAADVFRALRTQPGFDLYVMNWATNNRNTTGQLRIGGAGSAAAGARGAEPAGRATRGGRPRSAGGNRGLRKPPGARARGRRRTVSDVHARVQGPAEDRRSSSMRLSQAQDMYAVMLETSQELVKDIRPIGTEISYEESLMRFASAGGPAAEGIARKVLEEERAAAVERLQMKNQLPSAPPAAAQWNPPAKYYNNGDFVSPAPHLSRPPRSGLAPPAQGNMLLLGRQQGEATALPPPVFYDLTTDEGEPSMTAPSGFSFPPPSIVASGSAGTPGFGTRQQSQWLGSDVGSSSTAAGYKIYPDAANVPPASTMVGDGSVCRDGLAGEGSSYAGFGTRQQSQWLSSDVGSSSTAAGYKIYPDAANVPPASTMVGDGSVCRNGLAGEGSSYAGFLFGPRKLNYVPLFSAGSTSSAPMYQPPAPAPAPEPAPAPQVDMCDFLQLGSCNKFSADLGSNQLPPPVEPFDGFQYLLSVDDIGGPSGFAPNADAPAAAQMMIPDAKGKAPMVDPQPEPTSQVVLDLKLLQSRLGENPWGRNGISAPREPSDYTEATNADHPSSMEAGPSGSKHDAEHLSTLNLLGGRNPDLNLNL